MYSKLVVLVYSRVFWVIFYNLWYRSIIFVESCKAYVDCKLFYVYWYMVYQHHACRKADNSYIL